MDGTASLIYLLAAKQSSSSGTEKWTGKRRVSKRSKQ
jgi:hypothetical protein